MQDNRDLRRKGEQKKYSFMLRLKTPAGEVPPELHQMLDKLADKYGQGDLRITTRQAWQLHAVMKEDLGTVIKTLMDMGSSTIGACGDVSRNVMTSPAPFKTAEYQYMRTYAQVMAQLFKPMSSALTELWEGEKSEASKVANIEYWDKELKEKGFNIQEKMLYDSGRGIILDDPKEPLYGAQYLPKKFKIGITVPGDNSLDLYINDIGLVVIVDDKGELEGFNVMVGGGMGRTHNKETTFARAADHMGFVAKDDIYELCKAIIAAQRDHGNRDVRANARMKYLVHTLGIEKFTELVETYYGKKVEPWRPMKAWEYSDWMGWHEQGDGNLFLGINIVQGRVADVMGGPQYKKALKKIINEMNLTTVLSPTQSLIFKDVRPEQKARIEELLREHSVPMIEDVDPLVRKSIACPALPLCGLAVTEAERRMPDTMEKLRAMMDRLDVGNEQPMVRMTGCPNGCARPYMAEMALVGDGGESYQVWFGGSPVLEGRTGHVYADRIKYEDLFGFLEPVFILWRDQRKPGESLGDFTHRLGPEEVRRLSGIIDRGIKLTDRLTSLGDDLRGMKNDFNSFDAALAELKGVLQ